MKSEIISSIKKLNSTIVKIKIPIINKIVKYQTDFIEKNSISNINRDNYIIFLRTHGETDFNQKIRNKHREYLLPFTKHKVKFLLEFI